jgi:hypothetical protein
MEKRRRTRLAIFGLIIFACAGLFYLAQNWSSIGASAATPLRQIFGVRAVAQLETLLFNIQDGVQKVSYAVGLSEPESPFDEQALPVLPAPAPSTTPVPTATQPPPTAQIISDGPTPAVAATVIPTEVAATLAPTDVPWTAPAAESFGDIEGEAQWQPYLYDHAGQPAAVRTFLQPDPDRPFAIVAVVAIDLTRVDLKFVLGSQEPSRPGGPTGWGLIAEADRDADRLLAAFNGGFIGEHGGFGAMQEGITALAAGSGLATLAIYKDGQVDLGEWNVDLFPGSDYFAWRQNALMVIQDGVVNEKVYTGTWVEWGANLDYSVVTVRSGIGLSEDRSTLYYFAGPSMSMPTLADAMRAVDVYDGMLLDINPTHALFTAFEPSDDDFRSIPLYPEIMDTWVDRYLTPWKQDFFYLTLKAAPSP